MPGAACGAGLAKLVVVSDVPVGAGLIGDCCIDLILLCVIPGGSQSYGLRENRFFSYKVRLVKVG